jgi:hypothetical protein
VTANFKIGPAFGVGVAIAALAAALALPAGAAANDCAGAGSDPTAAQYCNSNQNVAPTSTEEGGSESQVAAASGGGGGGGEGGGSLPFTGTDLLALAAVAAAFMAIGLALKRLATARPGTD